MGERGSGSLVAAVVAFLMVALTAAAVCWAVVAAQHHRLQGAADLAALSGGQAQLAGRPACEAARRSADLNGARVSSCSVTGDEVEFVVAVRADALIAVGPWARRARAHANAGVITGSQP